jgi:hypothetical protein
MSVKDISSNMLVRYFKRFESTVPIILVTAATCLLPLTIPFDAEALLNGDASLTYSRYDGIGFDQTNPGQRATMTSRSLTQNYSLLYASNGPVYNSRVGSYNVALGYNWTALDTTFTATGEGSDNYSKTRGHLLYKGEITLDPKEVPFRLNAYSRDMTSNSITNSTGRSQMKKFDSIFGYREQATDINDGMHIENGLTLVAGVKNGMTNGYNEFLRHFPMILIDYNSVINRDLRSMSPVDDKLSRLAFVSLNKKDNWFHYRHTKYDDNLNYKNNYLEDEVQLGTVDQFMSRRWIDFSNWIKVSSDILFSKRKTNYQDNPIENINLNLFATGERKFWNVRSFSTFNRYKDDNNTISYQAAVPVYLSGVYNKDITWNARTSYRNNEDVTIAGIRSTFTNLLAGYRVDALKRSPFTVAQSLDIEVSKTNASDFLTFSGSIETASTSRFSRDFNFGASYNIKSSVTKTDAASGSNFMEHKLDLRGGYAATHTLRFDAVQSTSYTNGDYVPFNTTTRYSQTQLPQYYVPRTMSSTSVGLTSIHSLTTLNASWIPRPRLNFFLTVNEDVYRTDNQSINPVTEVLTGVTYSDSAWTLNESIQYTNGTRENVNQRSQALANRMSLRYIHSRSLDTSVGASYTTSDVEGRTEYETTVEQRINYSYYNRSGVLRKLLEINETLLYSAGSSVNNLAYNKSLVLGVNYYPFRQLTLSSAIGYSYTNSIRDYTIAWNASAVANFRLMQASLDFVHGIRKINDGKTLDARENKLTANVRKSF